MIPDHEKLIARHKGVGTDPLPQKIDASCQYSSKTFKKEYVSASKYFNMESRKDSIAAAKKALEEKYDKLKAKYKALKHSKKDLPPATEA